MGESGVVRLLLVPRRCQHWKRDVVAAKKSADIDSVKLIGPPATQFAVPSSTTLDVSGQWRFSIVPAHERQLDAPGSDWVQVAAVDRLGRLSPRASLRLAAA